MNVATIEEIDQLSYFDFLAYLGDLSLHPGGIRSTAEAFGSVDLGVRAKVLEVGCGTGFTTINLLNAGFNLTSCDANEKMVKATEENVKSRGYFGFTPIVANAAKLPFENNSFDFILIEAVMAFIDDIDTAVAEFNRVLKPGGFLGIVDMFYTEFLDEALKKGLLSVFGKEINVFDKTGIENVLKGNFNINYWKDYGMNIKGHVGLDQLEKIIRKKFPNLSSEEVEAMAERMEDKYNAQQDVFDQNRAILRYFVSTWSKSRK